MKPPLVLRKPSARQLQEALIEAPSLSTIVVLNPPKEPADFNLYSTIHFKNLRLIFSSSLSADLSDHQILSALGMELRS